MITLHCKRYKIFVNQLKKNVYEYMHSSARYLAVASRSILDLNSFHGAEFAHPGATGRIVKVPCYVNFIMKSKKYQFPICV